MWQKEAVEAGSEVAVQAAGFYICVEMKVMECSQAGSKIPQGCYLKSALTLKVMRIYTRETQLTPSLAGSHPFCSVYSWRNDKVARRHIRSRTKNAPQDSNTELKICNRSLCLGRKRQLRQGGLARLRWSKLLITSKLCTKVEGSSSAEWELQVAEIITSETPHPRPSTAGNRKWELVYQWLPNCRHYFDSNWNCGSWILGGVRGGVGGEWGRWGACVFYFSGRRNASYFSHNSLGLFSWLFSPISLFGAGSLTYF